MSLRLICGRSGTGKSEYCFDEIINRINNEKKIYIITPEQYTFAAEKRLINKFKNESVIGAEVLSFARMAHRVSKEEGINTKKILSKSGKQMLIYKILLKNKDKLNFLGKSKQNVDLISTALIEFKKHGVLLKDLESIYDNIKDEYLKLKIKDMILIYTEFEKYIDDKYQDENDILNDLINGLEKTNIFKDTIIYIDEFIGFTKQEYEIIKILLKQAKQVNICITTDNLDLEGKNYDNDLFYSNKITADKLLFIARSNNIECEKTIFLNNNYRIENEDLKYLERNLYNNLYTKYDKNVENIKIFLANNAYSEVENIAEKIVHLVKNENYRYRDIIVVSNDLKNYTNLIKVIFNKYEIPVFIDEKKDINQNIFIKYVVSILEIFARNWSYESVFNYIKTGLLDIEEKDIYKLENYCLKWGINRDKWYKNEWNYGQDEIEKEQMEILRKKIVDPLLNLKNEMSSSKTVEGISNSLYNFFIQNGINNKIEQIKEEYNKMNLVELANEQEMTWNIVIKVLDELVIIFKDEKITFENYNKLLQIGLNANSLGVIPQTQDEVICGDVLRSKQSNVKIAFIVGVNDGIYPSVNKDEGFFDDKDRERFKENGIELAKTTTENIYEESFLLYKIFSCASKKLFVSYVSSSLDGKTLRPSILITKIKKIFPNIIEESDIINRNSYIINKQSTFDELIINLRNLKEGKTVDKIWYDVYLYYMNDKDYKDKLLSVIDALNFSIIPEKINKDNIDRLYGNVLTTSISKLEKYEACPFSYFLTYGLKVNEKEVFKVRSLDTGNFMHEVIDEFFIYIRQALINIKEISEDKLYEIVEQIINEKLSLNKNYILVSTEKYQVLTSRLKRVVFKSMKYIIQSLIKSDFDVWGNEVEFNDGKTLKPIIIDLDNGKKVKIIGKIDRIDVAKIDGKNIVRIIDYKSSVKSIDLNEVISGLQIQLLTYVDVACEEQNMMPAGVLYYNLIDPIIKSKINLSSEQIEEEIRKKFKMQGLILADVKVAKMMDKSLDKGQSSLIPAYIDKEGNLSLTRSNAITEDQFKNLQKHIKTIIKKISNEILNGNIEIKPYYNMKNKKNACTYCSYNGICNFKPGQNDVGFNYIKNEDKQLILERLKEEKKEE